MFEFLSDPEIVLDLDDVMLRALDMAGTVASPTARSAAVTTSFFIQTIYGRN
jgi:hypothetical protein